MTVWGEAFVEILPETAKFAGKLSADVEEAVKKVEVTSSSSFDKLAGVGQKAFLGVAAAAAVLGVAAIKAAIEGQEAQAQLKQAVENVGGSFEEIEPKVEALSGKFQDFGYKNDQVEAAVTRLTQITGDGGRAIDLMGTAADLAAGRHLDLTTAANLVGRAAEGNITPLKKMGIQIADTGTQSGNAEAALKALNERFGGAAQAQADTFAGKMKAFQAEISNLTEKIGFALLPILTDMVGALGGVAGFFESNRAAALTLATLIGGPLAVAIGAYIIQQSILLGQKVAKFFTDAASAAVTAARGIAAAGVAVYEALGPVGLAIAGISALAIAFDKTDNSARDAGKSYGEAFVTNVQGAAGESEVLTSKLKGLRDANEELILAEEKRRHTVEAGGPAHAAARDMVAATSKEYQNNAGQIKVVQGELDKLKTKNAAATESQNLLTEASKTAGTTTEQLATQLGLTTEQVEALAKKLKIDLSKDATPDAIEQLTQVADRLHVASPAALELQDALDKLADKTADATEKSKAFKSALDLLIGGNIDAEKAVVDLYDKIDVLGQKLVENGTNLDFHTEKGRANLTTIEDTVTAIRNHIESMQHAGASANDMARALDGDTKSFDDQLKKAGFTTQQIKDMNTQYGLVPSSINTVVTANFAQLYAEAAKVNQAFANLIPTGTPHTGNVKVFGEGGYFDGSHPELAVVGDSREVMLPLDNPSRVQQLLRESGLMRGGSGGLTLGEGAISLSLSFGAGTTGDVVQQARRVFRQEIVGVLEEINRRYGARVTGGAS